MPAETPDPRPDTTTRPKGLPARTRAAIFDFDETLIDLEAQHAAADVALCRAFGSEYLDLPESYRFSSGTRIVDDIRVMRAFFRWTASEEEIFTVRQQHFDEACRTSELVLLPGVETTIRALHEKGLTLAVTSSAVGAAIDAILRRLDLRELFALIVDGSDVTHGKPDPEAYLVTARKLGVAPAECIVFEDSHVGVVAAKRAGMFCVAVPNARAQAFQDVSDADVVLGRMDEWITQSY